MHANRSHGAQRHCVMIALPKGLIDLPTGASRTTSGVTNEIGLKTLRGSTWMHCPKF
jgi:hypothetical protein